MAKPSVDQQVEYLKTAALLIGKAPAPTQVPAYKAMVGQIFQSLCELHEELVKEERGEMRTGYQG